MANLSIITDPVTKKQFARDPSVAGSLYEAYTPPAQQAPQPAPDTPTQTAPSAPTPSPLQTPLAAPTALKAPALPTPQAPAVQDTYITSLNEQAKLTRGAVENAYKTQLDRITGERKQAEENVRKINNEQGDIIGGPVQELSAPFREKLETSERDRLKVEENFFENQKLTDELDSLLTEGNALIARTKAQPISMQALNKRTAKTMSDVAARAGVIQAVMAARSGQIAEAERMIDRSVAAVNADRQDELAFYSTLLDFYENTKDEEGNKVAELKADEKKFLEAQIGLLENDMKQTDENVQTIKKAMLDPDLAQTYGQAGVTLNDTPEQIGQKLAAYGYQKEVRELSNDMAEKGYSFLTPGQSAPGGADVVTVTDSKGVQKQYYKAGSGGSGGTDYGNLTSSQKTAVDNLNSVMQSLSNYRALYDRLVGDSGVVLTGEDAGSLAGAYNALIFQIAQAAGTGALQAADREVVEEMIPNPTAIGWLGSSALGTLRKGGKKGGLNALDEAGKIFQAKKSAIGNPTNSPQATPTQDPLDVGLPSELNPLGI